MCNPRLIWWFEARIPSAKECVDCVHIVACQRDGVSNKPLGQRQDTGPGILWSIHRWTKGTNCIFDLPFLLRQGEPGTSQYIMGTIYITQLNLVLSL